MGVEEYYSFLLYGAALKTGGVENKNKHIF